MLISPHYHDRDWKRLDLEDPSANEDDWQSAADIVEDRVRGRLINWIDKIASDRFSGFAVVALDCILIESLYGFENGEPSPKNAGDKVYREFLARPRFTPGGFDKKAIRSFSKCIRNGITHDGETRKGWRIEKNFPSGMILDKVQLWYRLNRTEFHKAVVTEFEEWLGKVRSRDDSARKNMRERMGQIVKISPE